MTPRRQLLTAAAVWLLAGPALPRESAAETLPAPSLIPAGLAGPQRSRLLEERRKLEKALAALLDAAQRFNDNPAAEQTDREVQQIKQARDKYVRAVTAFNDEVRRAASAKSHRTAAKSSPIQSWSGDWSEAEKKTMQSTVDGFRQPRLRAWLAATPTFRRTHQPPSSLPASTDQMIGVSNGNLNIKDKFFSANQTTRENLLAFEAGKVLYNNTRGTPFGRWFDAYYGQHLGIIEEMRVVPHHAAGDGKPEGLGSVMDVVGDPYSALGYMLRVEALGLAPPPDERVRQRWNDVMKEFRARLDEALRQPEP